MSDLVYTPIEEIEKVCLVPSLVFRFVPSVISFCGRFMPPFELASSPARREISDIESTSFCSLPIYLRTTETASTKPRDRTSVVHTPRTRCTYVDASPYVVLTAGLASNTTFPSNKSSIFLTTLRNGPNQRTPSFPSTLVLNPKFARNRKALY